MERAPIEGKVKGERSLWVNAGILIAVVALLGVLFIASDRGGQDGSSDSKNWDLPALGSEGRVRLQDFRGERVVLNFFASWCGPCEFELPHFAAISKELEGRIIFVGVNTQDGGRGLEMARRFEIDHWPLAKDIGAAENDLHQALGGFGMPLTAFYNEKGELLDVAPGALSEPALRKRLADLYGV